MTAKRQCPYDDPNCTGKHGGGARKSELCPSFYAHKREYGRKYNREYNPVWLSDPKNKEYMRRYQHDYNRKATERIAAIKIERGCIDCGYNSRPEALDFDHRPGVEKLFNISSNRTRPWETILAEIAKCDVRCANCHRTITAERRNQDAA